jgi:NAD(P)-dependent dehydrogenase (short-subunit alcohol dehydrogenase family)
VNFVNKDIAITGWCGGIGRVLSAYLVEQGLTVFGLDCVTDGTTLPGVHHVPVDVTEEHSVKNAVSSVYRLASGPVDLVACAGIAEGSVAAEDMTLEQFDAIIAVNVRGVFLSCKYFGRELLARGGGSIVNVASMSGNYVVNVPQRQCAYNASKAAVTALTKSLAVEWGPRGVRVNAISPGYVSTPALASKHDYFQDWKSRTVLDRFADPSEIASAVAFLLSTGASYCCGTELLIDGGYSLR